MVKLGEYKQIANLFVTLLLKCIMMLDMEVINDLLLMLILLQKILTKELKLHLIHPIIIQPGL